MNLQNINWKIFFKNPAALSPEEFFRVFNGWIPDSPEIFIDVADYKHVGDGPVIAIIGHYVNYVLDLDKGRLGLLYDYKQHVEGSNEEKLRHSFLELLHAAKRLEGEEGFSAPPRFSLDEAVFTVNNRALAPNSKETETALTPDLARFFGKLYGDDGFELLAEPDLRRRFGVAAKAKPEAAEGLDLAAAIKRLS